MSDTVGMGQSTENDAPCSVFGQRLMDGARCSDAMCPQHGTGTPCGHMYGFNPDRCYLDAGHKQPHRNRWGTEWSKCTKTARPPLGDE